MHEHLTLLGLMLVVWGYGLFSRLLARYNITGPMVFTTVGVLLSPLCFGDELVSLDGEAVKAIAEIALIIVLFSDASGVDPVRLRRQGRLPFRLLFLALPATIVLAALGAKLFFPFESWLYLLLLALILAPTDAALGKAVVTDRRIPRLVRDTINVESGLNDGIVFPLFITVVTMIAEGHGGEGWLGDVALQIVLGALVGASAGVGGARLAEAAIGRGWVEHSYLNLLPIALAIVTYYAAETVGGNGFIAVYFAGLYLGHTSATLRSHVEEFAESEGEFLVMICFLVFGLVFVPATVEEWNGRVLLYALLSLTLFRMVPAVLALAGSGVDGATKLFLAWFGPRGIASVLYVLIAVTSLGGVEGHETIFAAISLTVFLSVYLHGLSARPLAAWYARTHALSEH